MQGMTERNPIQLFERLRKTVFPGRRDRHPCAASMPPLVADSPVAHREGITPIVTHVSGKKLMKLDHFDRGILSRQSHSVMVVEADVGADW